MKSPTLEEFTKKVEAFKPHWLYLNGPYIAEGDSVNKASLGPVQFGGGLALRLGCPHLAHDQWPCALRGGAYAAAGAVAFTQKPHTLAPLIVHATRLCSTGKPASSGDLLSKLEDIPLELVYLDAAGQEKGAHPQGRGGEGRVGCLLWHPC